MAKRISLHQIAALTNRHPSTVRYHLKKHGLKVIGGDAHTPKERGLVKTRNCPRHGETRFGARPDGGLRCLKCRTEAVTRWRRRLKRDLVEEAGGACALCGYNRHLNALHFHHLDPATKLFGMSERGLTRSAAEARAEAAKCILLCSNCHAEVEAGLTAVPHHLRR